MSQLILSFFFALAATLGFCILFHVPQKSILPASIVGGLGWLCYQFSVYMGNGKVLSCFLGACAVAILGDILSRRLKEAATVFVIPGILPLVPGAGAYYTMLAIIESDLERTAEVGTETLLMAGAIAVGLMAVASVVKIIVHIDRKIIAFITR